MLLFVFKTLRPRIVSLAGGLVLQWGVSMMSIPITLTTPVLPG